MKLLRTLAGALACAWLALATPALADGTTAKNASGSTVTMCTKTISAVEHPCHVGEVWDGSTAQLQAGDSSGNTKIIGTGSAGTPASGVVSMQGVSGMTPLRVGGVVANPSATITRPANTTAYGTNTLVANSTTAGSVTPFAISYTLTAACSGRVAELRLTTNHTTGLSGASFITRAWSAAPTYTNGDGGSYAVATGGANFLGRFSGSCEQFGDAAACVLTSDSGFAKALKLASGSTVYFDLMSPTGFTPQSGKTFTLTALVEQDAC